MKIAKFPIIAVFFLATSFSAFAQNSRENIFSIDVGYKSHTLEFILSNDTDESVSTMQNTFLPIGFSLQQTPINSLGFSLGFHLLLSQDISWIILDETVLLPSNAYQNGSDFELFLLYNFNGLVLGPGFIFTTTNEMTIDDFTDPDSPYNTLSLGLQLGYQVRSGNIFITPRVVVARVMAAAGPLIDIFQETLEFYQFFDPSFNLEMRGSIVQFTVAIGGVF